MQNHRQSGEGNKPRKQKEIMERVDEGEGGKGEEPKQGLGADRENERGQHKRGRERIRK